MTQQGKHGKPSGSKGFGTNENCAGSCWAKSPTAAEMCLLRIMKARQSSDQMSGFRL